MPSRPRSSVALPGLEFSRDETSMNVRFADTLAVLSNAITWPVFCTMYQRAALPGSCSIAMGCVKFARFGNTRCTAKLTLVLGGSPARHVALAGRASRPAVPPLGGAAPVVAVTAGDAADSLAVGAASKARTV